MWLLGYLWSGSLLVLLESFISVPVSQISHQPQQYSNYCVHNTKSALNVSQHLTASQSQCKIPTPKQTNRKQLFHRHFTNYISNTSVTRYWESSLISWLNRRHNKMVLGYLGNIIYKVEQGLRHDSEAATMEMAMA